MTTILPISSEVQSPYDTAIRFTKGTAVALSVAAITTLFPPAAGVLGIALATKTIVILTSVACASAITAGGCGFAAVLNFRAGYQALFEETVQNRGERAPLIRTKDTSGLERELQDAMDSKKRLEDSLKQKEKEIGKLNDDIEEMRKRHDADNVKWNEELAEKGAKIDRLSKELEEAHDKIEAELKTQAALKTEIEKKQSKIDELTNNLEEANKQNSNKQARIDELNKEIDSKKSAIENLTKEITDKQAAIDKLETKIGDLKSKHADELKGLEDQIEELKKVPAELEEEKIKLEREIHQLKKELTEALKNGPDEKLKKEIADLKAKIQSGVIDPKDLAAKVERIKKLESDLAKANDESNTRKKELSDLKDQLSKLQTNLIDPKELAAKIDRIRKLESDLVKEVDEAAALKLVQAKEIRQKDLEISRLTKEMADLKDSHEKELKTRLRTVKDDLSLKQIDIEDLTRKLKRAEEELTKDKARLSQDIDKLTQELQTEKKGSQIVIDSHTEEKVKLEAKLKDEIEDKQKEIEALKNSVEAIRLEHQAKAKDYEAQLMTKIQNVKAEMLGLQEELDKQHVRMDDMMQDAQIHKAVKEELNLSRKRLGDALKQAEELRESNKVLKEQKENSIELFELRTMYEESQRFNENYLEEIKGKVGRIKALEDRVSELEIETANLKGQPIEHIPVKPEPTRWSVRLQELKREAEMPKEVVNAGQDSKENTYHVIPQHRLDMQSVITKFNRSKVECDDFELMTYFKEMGNRIKQGFEKDKIAAADAKVKGLTYDFHHIKEQIDKIILDIAGEKELQPLQHLRVQKFFKIGVFYFESNVISYIFDHIISKTALTTLIPFLEGYVIRVRNGIGIAHDTALDNIINRYVNLCETNYSFAKDFDHSLFFEAIFILIQKGGDNSMRYLALIDRLGLMSDAQAMRLYEKCLNHYQHPDTNSLCIFMKDRVGKIKKDEG